MPKQKRRLKVLRAEQEVTQHELSMKVGMHRVRYAEIETGMGAAPRDTEREAIAAALGVKASDIDWPPTYQALRA